MPGNIASGWLFESVALQRLSSFRQNLVAIVLWRKNNGADRFQRGVVRKQQPPA